MKIILNLNKNRNKMYSNNTTEKNIQKKII